MDSPLIPRSWEQIKAADAASKISVMVFRNGFRTSRFKYDIVIAVPHPSIMFADQSYVVIASIDGKHDKKNAAIKEAKEQAGKYGFTYEPGKFALERRQYHDFGLWRLIRV